MLAMGNNYLLLITDEIFKHIKTAFYCVFYNLNALFKQISVGIHRTTLMNLFAIIFCQQVPSQLGVTTLSVAFCSLGIHTFIILV